MLVTHLAEPDEIVALARSVGVTAIQLHGETSPAQAAEVKSCLPPIKIFKAIHVVDHQSIDAARQYAGTVDAIVLDTVNVATDQVGGTGRTHDWSISRQIVERLAVPVVLAGGYTQTTSAKRSGRWRPTASTSTPEPKAPDGFKDHAALKRFIDNAKR